MKKLFKDRGSITQVIHHSHVWGAHFATYAAEVEGSVSERIKNVKGAKHRHESAAKPRGRFVLLMDAYIQLAIHMLHGRDDATKKCAEGFLTFLNEEVALQAAMLADATDEGLLFTRVLDNEGTDAAQMQILAEEFLSNLQSLFCDRQCLHLEGTYTHFMIESLRRPRVFAPTRSSPQRRLGGRPVDECVIDCCIERMVRYVKLVAAVTAAEFPSFSLFCAFQVFHLEKRATLLASDVHGGRRPSSAVCQRDATDARRACDANDARRAQDQDRHLRKLAKFFEVDARALSHQYQELKVFAQRHKSSTGCDNAAAWREAVRRSSARHKTLGDHPHKEVIHVLMRYVAFSISTAAVEQNFSTFKRVFGEQALHGGCDFENRMVKLILMRHSTPERDDAVCRKAQEVYLQYGGMDKGPYQKRRDAGLARPQACKPGTEKRWLVKRRAVVRAAAAKRPRVALEAAVEAFHDSDEGDDASAAAQLRKKQCAIREEAKIDAYLDGVLLEEEQDPDLQERVEAELCQRDKRAKTRAGLRRRLALHTHVWSASAALRDVPCYVDPATKDADPELVRQLQRRGCHCVPRERATIFVVEDVTAPGLRVHWNAVLRGGFLVTPRAFEGDKGKGPIICLKAASKVQRVIYMTELFRERHPEVARAITGVATWKILDSLEDRRGNKRHSAIISIQSCPCNHFRAILCTRPRARATWRSTGAAGTTARPARS